jgi:chemotaxis protein methyltransferase CheR
VTDTCISDAEMQALLESVFRKYHYDFREYAQDSLHRRVAAAMYQLNAKTAADLEAYVLSSEHVFAMFVDAVTVRVSDMFRDPEFFEAFRVKIVPELATYPSIRVWVAGCSSGEEAYSFAIVLAEAGLLQRTQIYATDISPRALAQAREGIYPLRRFAAFESNYHAAGGSHGLRDHCALGTSEFAMGRELKRRILFSDHSLATDQTFGEVQVASCRNVLIYFQRSLQERALNVLDSSLVHRGFLGLGSREQLPLTMKARFEAFATQEHWYRRR